MSERSVLTIGNFDGVHIGHGALLARARRIADGSGARVVAVTFDPHPRTVLRPGASFSPLATIEQRTERLTGLGADDVVVIEPLPEVLAQSAEAFVGWLVERFRPGAIVEGQDFRFGAERGGDIGLLRTLGGRLGFDVEVVDAVEAVLTDQTVVAASSSIVRWLIMHGRVGDAARVLGRPYELAGTVCRGDQRGREIGFPTANLRTPCAIPADGVYAGWARLPDGRVFPAAVHVGPRATFDSAARTVEAHLPGWGGPLAEGGAEYGWPIRLSLTAYLRDQARFESVGALVEQIGRDTERAVRVFGDVDPPGGARDRALEKAGA